MSSSALQHFQFESNEIRFVEIGEVVYAVGVDVARALGYSDPSTAILRKVYSEYKTIVKTSRVTGEVDTVAISEPGIYQLIFSSKLESADKFRRWVFEEVLPSIRKTGSYSVHQEPQQALPPKRDSVDFTEVHKYLSTINDLSIADLLRDKLEEDLYFSLGRQNPRAIAAAKPKEYTIGKVRARDLGYSDKQIGNGSALGRFLAKNVPVAYVQRVGKYDVKHYEVGDTLDTAIKSYFGMKALVTV